MTVIVLTRDLLLSAFRNVVRKGTPGYNIHHYLHWTTRALGLHYTMAKETKETISGKLKDQTFDVFDEKVLTWCRKQFGAYYAKGLWRNTLVGIDNLDMDNDEDEFTFEMHCARVYDVLAIKSPKEADHLYQSDRFWTKKWQLEFRQRCRKRLFCHLEEACSGEAVRQLRRLCVRLMETMRDYMFRRFGAGQPEVLQERVRLYLLGMPDPHGVAFPSRVDIEIKLDELEQEREYLLEMCPTDMRDTYEDGKEETLVRVIVRHLPAEYDQAVKAVKDLARLRKYSEGGMLDSITNCKDNTRANYATDYLPNYAELRVELTNAYQLAERRRGEMNKKSGKKGHPSFPIMDGHAQTGVGQMSCYRCGVAGDSSCKAKEGEVQKEAPEWFRKQGGAPQRGGKGGGKGKGKGWGKGGDRKAKPLCHNWSKGNGYCRYAAACNFSHDGPQGGGKRKWKDNPTSLPAKAIKHAKNKKCPWSLKQWLKREMMENPRQDPRRRNSSSFVEEQKRNQWG